MRVMIVSDDFYPACIGGAGLIAYFEALGLAQAGHDVDVVTVNYTKDDAEQQDDFRIHSLTFPKMPGYKHLRPWLVDTNPWLVARLIRLLDRIRPEIVHFHNVHQFLSYAALGAVAKRYPTFVTLHDMMSVGFRKMMPDEHLMLDGLAQRRVRAVNGVHTVAVSDIQACHLRVHGVRVDRVIYNGIPDLLEAPLRSEVSDDVLDRAAGSRLVMFAGRIGKLKGFDLAVEAVRGSGAKLLVVGTPGQDGEEILYVPWIDSDEVAGLYPLVSAVIVPSLSIDAFPTVILEAMRAGRPTIASKYSGGCESVVDGETGAVVDPRDVDRIRGLIRLWAGDSATANELGQAARKRFEERFVLERHIESLVGDYREVVS